MVFWICVVLSVIFILVTVLADSVCIDWLWMIGILFSAIGVIAALVMLFFIIGGNVGIEGNRAALEEQYKALIYKARTDECRDRFGIINKNYIDEVQRWNTELVRKQGYQNDFWIGIFFPDIYDGFQTIDLNEIAYRKE